MNDINFPTRLVGPSVSHLISHPYAPGVIHDQVCPTPAGKCSTSITDPPRSRMERGILRSLRTPHQITDVVILLFQTSTPIHACAAQHRVWERTYDKYINEKKKEKKSRERSLRMPWIGLIGVIVTRQDLDIEPNYSADNGWNLVVYWWRFPMTWSVCFSSCGNVVMSHMGEPPLCVHSQWWQALSMVYISRDAYISQTQSLFTLCTL